MSQIDDEFKVVLCGYCPKFLPSAGSPEYAECHFDTPRLIGTISGCKFWVKLISNKTLRESIFRERPALAPLLKTWCCRGCAALETRTLTCAIKGSISNVKNCEDWKILLRGIENGVEGPRDLPESRRRKVEI